MRLTTMIAAYLATTRLGGTTAIQNKYGMGPEQPHPVLSPDARAMNQIQLPITDISNAKQNPLYVTNLSASATNLEIQTPTSNTGTKANTLEAKVRKIAESLIKEANSLRNKDGRGLQVIEPIDADLDGTEEAESKLTLPGGTKATKQVKLNDVWETTLAKPIKNYISVINNLDTEDAVYKCALDATTLLIKPRECNTLNGAEIIIKNRIAANGVLAIMDQLTGSATKEATRSALRSLSSDTVKLPAQIGLIILDDITSRRNALETKILKDNYNMEQSDINNLQNMHSDIGNFPFIQMGLETKMNTEVTNLKATYKAAMLKRYIVAGTKTATVDTAKQVTLKSLLTETDTLDWTLFPNPFPNDSTQNTLFDEIKQLQEDINKKIRKGLTQGNFETTVTNKKTLLEKLKELVNSIDDNDQIMTLFANKYKSKSEIISSIDSAKAEVDKRHWIGTFMIEMKEDSDASDFAKQALSADKSADDTGEHHAYKQFVKFKSNKIQDPLDYLVSKVKEGNSTVSMSIEKIEKITGNLDKIKTIHDEQNDLVENYLSWTQEGDLRTDLEQANLVNSKMNQNLFEVSTEADYNFLDKDSEIYESGFVQTATDTITSIATAVSEAWKAFTNTVNIETVTTALKSILEQSFSAAKEQLSRPNATLDLDQKACDQLLRDNCTELKTVIMSTSKEGISGTTTKGDIEQHYSAQFNTKKTTVRSKLEKYGKDFKNVATIDTYNSPEIASTLAIETMRSIFIAESTNGSICSQNTANSSQYQIDLDPANNTAKFNDICTAASKNYFKNQSTT
jgi:hypothetical protein